MESGGAGGGKGGSKGDKLGTKETKGGAKDSKDGCKIDYRDRATGGDPMTKAMEGTTAVPRNVQVPGGNLNTFKPVPKATMTNARFRDYNLRGR